MQTIQNHILLNKMVKIILSIDHYVSIHLLL